MNKIHKIPKLSDDVFRIIIIELQHERSSLYSCVFVNRSWCRIAMPILWKNPFGIIYGSDEDSRYKLYSMLGYLLSILSEQLLLKNYIKLPSPTFPVRPLFN